MVLRSAASRTSIRCWRGWGCSWRPAGARRLRQRSSLGVPFVARALLGLGIVGHGVCKFGLAFDLQNHPNVELVAVSDLFDFSIYVDARTSDVKQWYVDRFLSLRRTAFARPESYFHRYASLTDDEAVDRAESIWDTINAPNLEQNILPTRSRATLVLTKGADHSVQRVRLRKI